MWRTDIVTPDPDSWSVVWDGGSKYAGKVTAYDYEIYIADAAVYLMSTKPDLGITDPYSLDATQFQAAVDLLKEQRKNITTYWSAVGAQVDAFTKGDMVVGTTWQAQVNTLNTAKVPIKSIKPKEGTTGWSDTWMISPKAKHPNCMYLWMDYIISPVANATATVFFGEAPVSPQGCAEAEKQSPGHCETFHATDEDLLEGRVPLEHAVQGVHRRSRADLHGLLRVDRGLDRDQGLGQPALRDRRHRAAVPAFAGRSLATLSLTTRCAASGAFSIATRASSWARCSPRPSAGSSSPISGRWRCCSSRVLDDRAVQRRGRHANPRSTTSRRS